ncbi:MAG: restriction endonuclease [Cellvibrio sp. 79]|nr:MAG: restriction endonuclease [Cellvibrio sp. 79]
MSAQQIITQHLDIWTASHKTRSSAGRGSSNKLDLYGIKKLRELILELAVRGKLVSQNPNDEPASELLKKIAAEKAKLIKEGKNKNEKPLPEITDEEKLIDLPSGWEFVRFIDVLDFNGGSQPPKSQFSDLPRDGYVQLIQIRDLGPNPQPVYVPKESVSKFCTKKDVMIGRYGASVGKVFWGRDGAYNVALIKIQNAFKVYSESYIFWLMTSPLGQSLFSGISRSAQDGFSKEDIALKILSLPPLAEQHRIVAKVDELMGFCDQLEQTQSDNIAAHAQLVEALLASLTNSADHKELQTNWQRIAAHFDTLFTTEHSIDQLKQTILQLAVMGKLVPQNPNDEPGSELLKKITAEKSRLIKEGKIKNHLPVEPIGDQIFLPDGWIEVVIQDFADVRLGSTPSRAEPKYWNGNILWVSSGEVANCIIMDTEEKITKEGFANSSTSMIPARSLLMAIIGQGKTRGQTALLGVDACTNQNVAAFVFNENFVVPEFVWLWARSKYDSHRGDGRGGAQPALNGKIVRSFRFPLPPFNEQQRIVAKVDELMVLCDSLKTNFQNAQTNQLALADALVEQAVN